ncbi:hypothetical protein FPV67DRAFT_1480518 [Lyophyllum atratum]|nr:hypothetical protein FPV67DRAFT_1480518 [Lyophyllum atratum]
MAGAFALAAAPPPLLSTASVLSLFSLRTIATLISNTAYLFEQNLAPPYILLFAEVLSMFPHAYRSHQRCKGRLGEQYPKDRTAIVPFLF